MIVEEMKCMSLFFSKKAAIEGSGRMILSKACTRAKYMCFIFLSIAQKIVLHHYDARKKAGVVSSL